MKEAFRFSFVEINVIFIDLHGDKWKKLDNVRPLSEIYPFVTENFPAEQIVYVVSYCPHCKSEPGEDDWKTHVDGIGG